MSTLIGGIFKNVKLNKCLEKEKTHNMDLRINHNRLNLFNCNKLLKINKKSVCFALQSAILEPKTSQNMWRFQK